MFQNRANVEKQMVGTPHTTKVGHTFPLVTLVFMTCAINLSLKPVLKKAFIFFIFLNFLGNHHVTVRGDLDPVPA